MSSAYAWRPPGGVWRREGSRWRRFRSLRLPHCRDDAPDVPTRARSRPRRVPPSLPPLPYRPCRLMDGRAEDGNPVIHIQDSRAQGAPSRSRFSYSTSSPRWTRWGPTRFLPLPGGELTFVAPERGQMRTDTGPLALLDDASLAEVPTPTSCWCPAGRRSGADGRRPRARMAACGDETSTWTISVCTGSLILAAAGLMEGKRATSHWQALEELAGWGGAGGGRVVFDGKLVTAAGSRPGSTWRSPRGAGRGERSRRRSNWASSTTPSHRSTPARRTKRPPRSSRRSALTRGLSPCPPDTITLVGVVSMNPTRRM